MININLQPNGECHVSIETPEERAAMQRVYSEDRTFTTDEKGSPEDFDILQDEDRAHWFKEGWDAAIREAQIHFVNERMPEFFNEQTEYRQDVESTSPEHTPPLWPDAEEQEDIPDPELVDWMNERVEPAVVRPVTDSGEPEKEAAPTCPEDATWVIPNEELEARLEAERELGAKSYAEKVRPALSKVGDDLVRWAKDVADALRGDFH